MKKCTRRTAVYSRVTGYYSAIAGWNKGKKQEYSERKPYTFKK